MGVGGVLCHLPNYCNIIVTVWGPETNKDIGLKRVEKWSLKNEWEKCEK